MRIDPFEELRELEGIARRQTGRRGIFTTEELYRFGSELGADALGLESWPGVEIDLDILRSRVPSAMTSRPL